MADTLEQAPQLKVSEIVRRLNISRSTFYTIRFFRERVHYPSPGCPRWMEADLRLYQANTQGKVRGRRKAAA